jgi:hypothetical protein
MDISKAQHPNLKSFTKIDKGALTNMARELLYFRGFFVARGDTVFPN